MEMFQGCEGGRRIEGGRSEQRGLFHALKNTEERWGRGVEGGPFHPRFRHSEALEAAGAGGGRVGTGGLLISERGIVSHPGVFRGSAPPWCFQNKIIFKSLELQVCLLSGGSD